MAEGDRTTYRIIDVNTLNNQRRLESIEGGKVLKNIKIPNPNLKLVKTSFLEHTIKNNKKGGKSNA